MQEFDKLYTPDPKNANNVECFSCSVSISKKNRIKHIQDHHKAVVRAINTTAKMQTRRSKKRRMLARSDRDAEDLLETMSDCSAHESDNPEKNDYENVFTSDEEEDKDGPYQDKCDTATEDNLEKYNSSDDEEDDDYDSDMDTGNNHHSSNTESNNETEQQQDRPLDKPIDKSQDVSDNASTAPIEDDKKCVICSKADNGDKFLLCDECDDGYHIWCIQPPLIRVPPKDVDWFCRNCGVSEPTEWKCGKCNCKLKSTASYCEVCATKVPHDFSARMLIQQVMETEDSYDSKSDHDDSNKILMNTFMIHNLALIDPQRQSGALILDGQEMMTTKFLLDFGYNASRIICPNNTKTFDILRQSHKCTAIPLSIQMFTSGYYSNLYPYWVCAPFALVYLDFCGTLKQLTDCNVFE